MKITIDVQPLLGPRSGVGRYIWGLIQGLSMLDSPHEFQLAFFDFKRRADRVVLPGPRFRHVRCRLPGRVASLLWKHFSWPRFDQFFGEADVVHFPNFIIRPVARGRKIATVHDVSFLRLPQFTEPKNLKFLSRLIRRTVQEADRIIADSEFTRKELEAYFDRISHKIRVVHLGVDGRFKPAGSPGAHILFVGTVEPRKNLELLIEAFEILTRRGRCGRRQLVIAGMKGWLYDGIMQRYSSSPCRDRIRFVDYVADEDLPGVYGGAAVFAYPSHYEGFGLPPLEAMACAVPVVASNRGSLPEVLGDAAVLVDPGQPETWAVELERVLTDADLRGGLIARGLARSAAFRWERTAQRTLEVYKEAIQGVPG